MSIVARAGNVSLYRRAGLLQEGRDREFSELVQELLERWLESGEQEFRALAVNFPHEHCRIAL